VRIDRRDGGRRGAVEVLERLFSSLRVTVGRELRGHHRANHGDQNNKTVTHPSTPSVWHPPVPSPNPMRRA
jgi:hypothetical protein